MYIITFYSFKGGVGRTMAMANVGLALARDGRRVLLVDFDLEAPGLDTFDLLKPAEPTPGIVDYVTEFCETGVAPDVSKFVYEPSHPGLNAKVWVMPSGKQDEQYGNRLNAIDWNRLYAEQDGYLLFEDLKKQWERELHPDYVFVDSRTGHTDTGGICTRQLPDAVALLFIPNEQNLRGLQTVARDIRRESRESGRLIQLYFVAANVPDLDDEDSTLRERLRQFRRALEANLDATIHHYDSLSLIEQTVFTIERPRTKLTREYGRLAKKITSRNFGDRAVVLEFLESVLNPRDRSTDPTEIKDRLNEIRRRYADDGEILYELARASRGLGRVDEAEQLMVEAHQQGFLSVDELIDKAIQDYGSNSLESARLFVRRALALSKKPLLALDRILSIILAKDLDFLPELLAALSSRGLQPMERLYLAGQMMVRRDALPIIEEILYPLTITEADMQDSARSALALCLIAQRRYGEAQAVIVLNAPELSEQTISDSFNYAMSAWGATKTCPKDQFLRVVKMDAESPRSNPDANYHQCLAIANWAVGRVELARECSTRSRSEVDKNDMLFSAWRYLRVPSEEFIRDLDSLDAMIATGTGQPTIVCDHD